MILTSEKLKAAAREWNKYFASFWKGVTRKKPPKLTNRGMAAYHDRWADTMSEIAQRQLDKTAAKYYNRESRKHRDKANQYREKIKQ